jgi:hypothetical protein
MRDDDEQTSNRPVVALRLHDVLWVPHAVSRFLIPHARSIADATVEDMPQINWGVAVLAVTYRGMCTGCTKTGTQSILIGCPLLLHLWSYDRLPVGQPSVDRSPYHALEEGHDPADRPTMGSMWCHHQVRTSS